MNIEATACSCDYRIEGVVPCEAFWDSDAVFIGRVVRIRDVKRRTAFREDYFFGDLYKVVTFRVEEAFRGVHGRTVQVLTPYNDATCGYTFRNNERYFVYASDFQGKNVRGLVNTMCGYTFHYDEADSWDLAHLSYGRAAASGKVPAGVFGCVVRDVHGDQAYRWTGDYGLERFKGLRVDIIGADESHAAVTDERGFFQVDGLRPGQYTVHVALPGHLKPVPDQKVTVEAGRCTNATLVIVAADGGVGP
jgi:hypothetical protein